MVGVAVKVTDVPAQIGETGLPAALTLAVTFDIMVMVIGDEVALVGEAQPELEVITTRIASVFTKVVVV